MWRALRRLRSRWPNRFDAAKGWAVKSFWAVSDQALFAVSNFALNVLLARWLTPSDYGAFVVVYAVFLLLGTFHSAILSEPMLVYGSGKYLSRFSAYIGVLLRGHWLFGVASSALFAVAALILLRLPNEAMASAAFGLSVASPFILYQWLLRRTCYVKLQPQLAALAGTIYMTTMGGGLFLLYEVDSLSIFTALLVVALASLVSGAWISRQLRVPLTRGGDRLLRRDSFEDHLAYGRWAAGAAALSWIAGNVVIVVLPLFADLSAVGTLRAALNLIMPIMQIIAALGTLVLPQFVRARARGTVRSEAFTVLAFYLALTASYAVLLLAFSEPLIVILYGVQYPSLARLLLVLSSLPMVGAVVAVLSTVLRALERPRALFIAYAWSASVALIIGTGLISALGIGGAAVSIVLAALTTAIVLLVLLRSSVDGRHQTTA